MKNGWSDSAMFLPGLLLGAILSGGPDALAAPAPPPAQPNIIFIMADDMGYGDLGCYGQELIQTPNIDALARAGTRFTHCYTGSPVCAPSRSVLMTGLHTGHTTVRGNFGQGGVKGLGGQEGRVPLRAEDLTVAEVLQRAGYRTGITGKWGLGEPGTAGLPNAQGFDEWLGYLNQRRAHTYYPDYIWRNGDKFLLPGNAGGKKQQYVHDLFTEFALDFISRNRRGPFFLYLAFTIPHARLEPPSVDPYADKPWKPNEKAYAAMITHLDCDVGRVMARLQELELRQSTIVFFCSDNGAANRYDGRFDSSGPLRGRKRDLYEGGIRTPMIVSWPGRIPAGRVSDAVWYFADFLPTAAELAGAKIPPGLDGVSVVPTLAGRPQDNLRDRFLYWEFFEPGFQQAARWRQWKAVRLKAGQPLELYDLARDPAEQNNVAALHPETTARLKSYLETAHVESPHWPTRDR